MKEYQVNINLMPVIRAMFYGYIFRRTENGKGYVKCTDAQKRTMERKGIKLEPIDN